MDEKKKVPKLRYPGYTDYSEQRKYYPAAKLSKGNGYTKRD